MEAVVTRRRTESLQPAREGEPSAGEPLSEPRVKPTQSEGRRLQQFLDGDFPFSYTVRRDYVLATGQLPKAPPAEPTVGRADRRDPKDQKPSLFDPDGGILRPLYPANAEARTMLNTARRVGEEVGAQSGEIRRVGSEVRQVAEMVASRAQELRRASESALSQSNMSSTQRGERGQQASTLQQEAKGRSAQGLERTDQIQRQLSRFGERTDVRSEADVTLSRAGAMKTTLELLRMRVGAQGLLRLPEESLRLLAAIDLAERNLGDVETNLRVVRVSVALKPIRELLSKAVRTEGVAA